MIERANQFLKGDFAMAKFIVGVLAFLVLVVPASAQADKKKPPTQKEIVELVTKLSDAKFTVREQAQKALIEIGRPALPELRKAADAPDVEMQMRARRIIRAIENPPAPGK